MIRSTREMNAARKAAEGYTGMTVEYRGQTYTFVSLAPAGGWGMNERQKFQQFSDSGRPMGTTIGSTRTRRSLADLGTSTRSVVLHADTKYGPSRSLVGGDPGNFAWLGHASTPQGWRNARKAAGLTV